MPNGLDAAVFAAETAADAAGAVLRRAFRAGVRAEAKADSSPVTVADLAAEGAIRAVLGQFCPEDGIEGEELAATGAGAARSWVIDPLDGTRAFVTGRPTFVTLIALLEDGRPVLGLIDQPVTGERWLAAGGMLQFRGSHGVAGCRPCPSLAEARLSATTPAMFGPLLPRFQALEARTREAVWGGDGYMTGLLALGQIDIVAEATMKFWDWAALVPVVEAAGGRITDWAGQPLRADGDGTVLAVGDPGLHAAAVAALAG